MTVTLVDLSAELWRCLGQQCSSAHCTGLACSLFASPACLVPTPLHVLLLLLLQYDADCEDYSTYPKAKFISEFGSQSYPTFATYAEYTAPSDWQVSNAATVQQRSVEFGCLSAAGCHLVAVPCIGRPLMQSI